MTLGDKIAAVCILLYIIVAVAYCWNREWWKAVYYLAAAVLNVAVVMMKT
jgi:hypothetical protein